MEHEDRWSRQKPDSVVATITLDPQDKFYITEIQLLVDQSSTVGQAIMEEGGVGTNHMVLKVYAQDTNLLEYKLNVFGRDYQ